MAICGGSNNKVIRLKVFGYRVDEHGPTIALKKKERTNLLRLISCKELCWQSISAQDNVRPKICEENAVVGSRRD